MTLERVCSVHDVEPGEAKRFDLGNLRLAVVRIDDEVAAYALFGPASAFAPRRAPVPRADQ